MLRRREGRAMQKLVEPIRAGVRGKVKALLEADSLLAIFAAGIQGDTAAIEILLAADRGWFPR